MPDFDVSEYEMLIASADGDPRVLLRILSGRVVTLTIEKERLEADLDNAELSLKKLSDRVEKMEIIHTMGRGALIVIPIVGAIVTLLLAKGAIIFGPWMSKP